MRKQYCAPCNLLIIICNPRTGKETKLICGYPTLGAGLQIKDIVRCPMAEDRNAREIGRMR